MEATPQPKLLEDPDERSDRITAILPISLRSPCFDFVSLEREIQRVQSEIKQLFDDYPMLRRQRELLISIPGIAETTAAPILGEMPNLSEFRDVKAVAAYAGLSPRHYQSESIAHRSRLAKTGNAHLRYALYFPALVAIRHNPSIRSFAERLRSRGKARMTIVAAAMRKLLTLAYGVLKADRAFDPAFAAA